MEHRPFGHLDPVDPGTVWNSEPGEFVPWLLAADNLRRLGDALGLDLEPVAREAPVGRFRADLVCRDRGTDTRVVIEAQLNPSGHSHLGQLLTYAEGLGAHVVVWLGTRFHDEHRAVLGRLNRSVDLDLRFFAVAIDLWRIDGSPTAPQFTVLAAPRDWPGPAAGTPGHRPALTLKQVADAAGLSTACVAHIETGRNKGTPKTLAAIERALNMAPGALAGCGKPPAAEPGNGEGQGAAE